MNRRLLWTIGLTLVGCAVPLELSAQNTRADWSTLDMGFASSKGTNALVRGAVGQTFVGAARAGDTLVLIGFMSDQMVFGSTVRVAEGAVVPGAFSLMQNFPNPFNPTTVVRYQLPIHSSVRLVVYDLLGREVTILVDGNRQPGSYDVPFDGSRLASGIYVYRLTAGAFVQTRKMILLR